jgi:Family of unknown function (DUF6491)
MRLHLTLATAVFALAGCASTTGAPKAKGAAQFEGDARLGAPVDKVCFASNIDSFGDTTRDTFTVREGKDHYLIEVFGTCSPLQHAMTMRMDATMSCLRKGDHVIVSDSLTGGRGDGFSTQRCMVKEIYAWDPKAKDDADAEENDTDAAADKES